MKFLKLALTVLASMAVGLSPAAAAPGDIPGPVKIVVGFPAGSAADIVARLLATDVARTLNQTVIVDNRPGASSMIAAEFVAKAAPDGTTLFLGSNTAFAANPFLFKALRYDPIKDFTPIARLAFFPAFLVISSKLPATDLSQLIESGRKQSKLNYAYGNSTGQVAGSTFVRMARMEATAIPYKGTPQALTDIIGGTADFMFIDLTAARAHINAGTVRAVGVASLKRSSLMPAVPSIAEAAGLDFEVVSWHGLNGPAKMAPELVAKLHAAFTKAIENPAIKDKLADIGAEPAPATTAQYDAFMRQQLQSWEGKIKAAGIQPE